MRTHQGLKPHIWSELNQKDVKKLPVGISKGTDAWLMGEGAVVG